MALKVVNTESLDAVANALNEAAGKSGKLVFPDEYISTAKGLSAGGGGGGDGYDIATMQKFIDARQSLSRLYLEPSLNVYLELSDSDLDWLTKVDLSKIQYAQNMFDQCESRNLTAIPLFDTSGIVNMSYMFQGRSSQAFRGNWITIPNLDTRNATNMAAMFQYRRLNNFPKLDYSSATNVANMFYEANFYNHESLIEAPDLELPKATSLRNMLDSILVAKFIPLFSCDFGALIFWGGNHRALNANCLRSYLRVRSVSSAFIVAFSRSTYASFQFFAKM